MKQCVCIVLVCALAALWPMPATAGKNIFQPAVERYAGEASDAFARGDGRALGEALGMLALNETRQLAIGKSAPENSYFMRIPDQARVNPRTAGAYIYLLRMERRGTSLWPISFFEGQRFRFPERIVP